MRGSFGGPGGNLLFLCFKLFAWFLRKKKNKRKEEKNESARKGESSIMYAESYNLLVKYG